MEFTKILSDRIGDSYYKMLHPSGLTIYVYPKKSYNSTYAIFGTNFGSIDTTFMYKGEKIVVPDGIAHYLEHKLFESEDGDAFAKYAKTGAMANAYTSFDKTCYLFSCSDNFEESLNILIDFVQSPYFTEKTVQKEQGIIGQEIKMYDDNANWRVMFNVLTAMYHNHPVSVDIAGTVESIADITAEKLYKCYECFYNLNNMSLCIAGNIEPQEVLRIVDKKLKPSPKQEAYSIFEDEPYEVCQSYIEQNFDIAMPSFVLGFKEKAKQRVATVEEIAATDIILYSLLSDASDLYNKLINEGLINDSFGYEYFEGRGYASVLFSGESRNPEKVTEMIKLTIENLHENGISDKDFEMSKRAIYGKSIEILDNPDNIADILISFDFSKRELYDYINAIAKITKNDIENRLKEQLDVNNCSLSVVKPFCED